MKEGKLPGHWSELNDVAAVEDMLTNSLSRHWVTCQKYVWFCIEIHCPDVTVEVKEEMVQDVCKSVWKGLSGFRWQSKPTTWIARIAENRTKDWYRQKEKRDKTGSLEDLLEKHDGEVLTMMSSSLEEEILYKERAEEVKTWIEEFMRLEFSPKNYERNKEIGYLHILEGLNYQEIAQKLGISSAVVGTVLRPLIAYLSDKENSAE